MFIQPLEARRLCDAWAGEQIGDGLFGPAGTVAETHGAKAGGRGAARPGDAGPMAPEDAVAERWRGVFLSDATIVDLRRRVERGTAPTADAWEELQENANEALGLRPHVRRKWFVPYYYNDPEGHRRAKGGLERDANAAYELALVYRMTGDERYARASSRLITAWSELDDLSTLEDSKLAFSYHFPAMIFAADLLKDSRNFGTGKQAAFKRFVRQRAVKMNTMDGGNNWGNWGTLLVMASGAYLRDRTLFDAAVARWKLMMTWQVAPDGHLSLEVTRNDGAGDFGIWYSNFSLMPQTLAAEVARVNGVNLFKYTTPSGRSLRLAFERIAPWVSDPGSFPYYKGKDKSKIVAPYYASYFEVLNARWPNRDASRVLARFRPMTAEHSAPALTFTHGRSLKF